MTAHSDRFLAKVADKTLTVGVVGLGYVGLPLALAFIKGGLTVVGLDIDPRKPEAILAGETYLKHIPASDIQTALATKRLSATTDLSQAHRCDALIICVPTPLTAAREPDLSFIENTVRALGPHLRPGQLLALESTTWPGTTDEIVKPLVQSFGHKAPEDVMLAFSPEREDPGNARFHTRTIPKIVGADDEASRKSAEALYACAVERVVAVSSTRAAELTKLLENIFRAVNIALVNELKLLCEKLHIDVWEVIDAAATKPFGFMPFYPGPGLGGHCIPIDPFYLTWKAREVEFQTRFIELAGEINTGMPAHVVRRVQDALNDPPLSDNGQPIFTPRALRGARVLLLGVAYKADVDDVRESPALAIRELLEEKGAQVRYHDPFVHKMPRTRKHGDLEFASVPLTDDELAQSDVVLIVTAHKDIDYAHVVQKARLVVDTRNACKSVKQDKHKVVRA
ncbi:MAG: nucleotide sugar dehydrogenase [Deltaproteobacteria bacterium]|nr:nucleotide sugar dehydrogenase [Deltaproteobacteria bacterium]